MILVGTMKIFDEIKLKKVSEEDIDFLYGMLKERDPIENILHKKMPTYDEHVKFVTELHPYDGWYIIMLDSEKLGNINIIHKENYYAGWFIKKEFQNLGIAVKAFEILKKLRFKYMKLPSLKYITQAGGKLGRALCAEFANICAQKNIKFYVMYGQAEATARISYLPWEQVLSPARLQEI